MNSKDHRMKRDSYEDLFNASIEYILRELTYIIA